MSILKDFILTQTQNRKIEIPPALQLQTSVTNLRPLDYSLRDEFRLELKISVSFFANTSELNRARRDALSLLNRHIYKDLIPRLEDVKWAIQQESREYALRAIKSLIEEFKYDPNS